MKTFLLGIILSALMLPACLHAQDDREDVMYLRSGTIYRGTIIEQVPGVSYRIEIAGGSVIYVAASEVEKIVKEKIYNDHSYPREEPCRGEGNGYLHEPIPKREFVYRTKGYFFQARAMVGMDMGMSVINGYKFGRFGMLGAGVGISAPIMGLLDFGDGSANQGPFGTLFAYYGGDILKKQVTPFYSVHAGYGFNLQPHQYDSYSGGTTTSTGGLMGGVSVGIRIYNKRNRINIGWALSFDIQQYGYSEPGNYYNGSQSVHSALYMPGTSISIGF